MAVFVPTYLVLSRHHIWYFRWPLPTSLYLQGKVRYVRFSLSTRDPKEALRLAKHLEYHAVSINRKLIASHMSHTDAQKALRSFFSKLLEADKRRIDADGALPHEEVRALQLGVRSIEGLLTEGEEKFPSVNAEVSDEYADRIIALVRQDIPDVDIQKGTGSYESFKRDLKLPYLSYCKELLIYNSRLRDYDFSTAAVQSAQPQRAGKTLKEVIQDFVAERMRGGEWTERTKSDREAQFALLAEMLGEGFDVTSLDAMAAADIKKVLQDVPKNRNKAPNTRGLSLKDALQVKGAERLHTRTVNEYLTAYQSLFGWAEGQGFIAKNPFKNLSIRQKKSKQGKRDLFTHEQIKSIIAALPEHAPEISGKSFRYWGILLGLYTGARLNEIAQLSLDDIKHENGIWYFDLNDEGDDKQLKNASSKRRVPIHAALLSRGILERVQLLREQGHKRLFPDLKHMKGHGYGRYLARWVNEDFLVALSLKTKTLSFHSFRHSFITNMLNLGISTGVVQELVGHSKDIVTEAVYNKGYNLHVLKEAIDKLSYA